MGHIVTFSHENPKRGPRAERQRDSAPQSRDVQTEGDWDSFQACLIFSGRVSTFCAFALLYLFGNVRMINSQRKDDFTAQKAPKSKK